VRRAGRGHSLCARPRRIGVVPAMAALALASSAFALSIVGAGAPSHAWVALREAPEQEDAAPVDWLYHLPGDAAEPGGALRVKRLRLSPEGVGATGARLLMVFPPESAPETPEGEGQRVETPPQRPVRWISVAPGSTRGLYRYLPSERLGVLPALPGSGRLVDVVGVPGGGAALIEQDGEPRIFRLSALDWTEVDLPDDWMPGGEARLTLDDERPALIGVPPDPQAPAGLWRLERAASADEASWGESRSVARPAPNERLIGAPAGIVGARRAADGSVALRLLRAERWVPIATLESVPEDYAPMTLGDDVLLAWVEAEEQGERLFVALVSTITGAETYRGPARSASPVSAEDLRVLALLLAAITVAIMILVLKPASTTELRLPENVALAGFFIRLGAATIDLVPGLLVASWIYDAPVGEIIATPLGGGAAIGLSPFLSALGVTFVYSAASEALTGRTVGKWALRLRTVAADGGGRPGLWQAVSRNLVKVIAPPIVILVALDPNRRHFGDLVAGTAVVTPAAPDEPDA